MISREDDTFVSLQDRSEMANEYGADVFVSIHQNAYENSSANGLETYYHINKGEHKPLSSEVQTNAIKETGAKDRGVKNANFTVLRDTTMVSSLIECGFITNPEESEKLASEEYQEKLATAIANGIEEYLLENITLESPEATPEASPTIKTGTVTASALNVRSGYGTSYSKIGLLSKGAKVEIIESKNGWHKIKYGSGYGYVSGEYIK